MNVDRTLRKLQKLRRDPELFLLDLLRKRVEVGPARPLEQPPRLHTSLSISDYEIVDDVAVVTDPVAVEYLRQFKRPGSSPKKIALCWWT